MRANVMTGRPQENPSSGGFFPNKGLILVFLMLPTVCNVPQVRCTKASVPIKGRACCSFPCKNGGSCMETCGGYICDCTGTYHYGRNCEIERLGHWLKKSILAGAKKLGASNFVTDMHLMQFEPKFFKDHGGFCNENFNVSPEPMLLSPVPEHCPTPLGIAGFQILPPIETLFDAVLKRRCAMECTTSSTNLLFVVFAQFLANQMWACTNSNWIGSSSMYGSFVRTGLNGKVSSQHSEQKGNVYQNVFTVAFQDIILCEHNRACDILSQEHPNWNDHQLFETATLVVTGEILTIASTEWLPLLHDFGGITHLKSPYPYVVSNVVPKEMKLALLWPQMFPDKVSIEGSTIDLDVLMSGGDRGLSQGGLYQLMKFAATAATGKMGPQNAPIGLEEATKHLIMEGRKWKFQSFNNYREYLGLGRLSSLNQFTNNNVVKKHLVKMYRDINGLELIPGLLLETPGKGKLLGETMDALISNMIFKAVVTHPLNTVPFKKKFTFGGKTGWDIVKRAKLQNLICNNVECRRLCEKEGLISFRKIRHPLSTASTASCSNAEKIKKQTGCKNIKTTGQVKKCRPLTPLMPKCTKGAKVTPAPVPVRPCSEKPIKTMHKTSFTPPVGQCGVQTPPAPVEQKQPATCSKDAEIKAPPCPTQAKKCCVKRPWFRAIANKFVQDPDSCSRESSSAQKGARKTSESCKKIQPKSGSCKTRTITLEKPELQGTLCPQQPKKCCVKRPWFKAFTNKLVLNVKPCLQEYLWGQKPVQEPACAPKNTKAENTKWGYCKICPTTCQKAEIKATPCPQQAKKCCTRRSWYKAFTNKFVQAVPPSLEESLCGQKPVREPPCAPKNSKTVNLKLENPCKIGTTTCQKADIEATDCPQQTQKCCFKRPWFKAIQIARKLAEKPICALNGRVPTCPPKNVEVNRKVKQKSESPCKLLLTPTKPAQSRKTCCAKRSWFRAWKRKC